MNSMHFALIGAQAGLAVAVPYPLPNSTASGLPGSAPAPSSCNNPGAALCNGPNFIGLCDIDNKVVWQHVAAGTVYSCDSSRACMQTYPGSSAPNASQPVPLPSAGPSSVAPPASSAPASTSLPAPAPPSSSGGSTYKVYTGDGSTAAGWPSMDDWASFEDMWKGYLPIIGKSCTNLPTPVRDNTQAETDDLKKALQAEAAHGNVPINFAFAIMMQESTGCVAVATTEGSVPNPGIFQAYNGAGTCFNTKTCPMSSIQQMAKDGICGTPLASGQGYQKGLQQDYADPQVASATEEAQRWYRVARLYNSGSINAANLNDGFESTACYVMDIANRIAGQWYTGTSACTLT